MDHHDELVPLGAVSDRQLDLTQREVIWAGTTAGRQGETHQNQNH